MLRQTYPHLRHKVTTILNGISVPSLPSIPAKKVPKDVRLIAVGRITPLKQADLLIKALAIVYQRRDFVPAATWVGRRDPHGADFEYAQALDRLLATHPDVAAQWTWAGERKDVPALIADHHLLVHPALHEGFSNVMCEALMLGRPILAGSVCDHPFLTGTGKRGGLFDVSSPDDLADQIERYIDMSAQDYALQCHHARTFATETLTVDRLVTEYENLLNEL